jgi:peptidyl-dipeptidase Dcp
MTTLANPMLAAWDGPLGLPRFDEYSAEQLVPALTVAISQHRSEIDEIASNPDEPTFANTALALDRSGAVLDRVETIFSSLGRAHTNPDWQAVETEMSPVLAAHHMFVSLHPGLFARVDDLHRRRRHLGLNEAEIRLVERHHLDMVRSGARLDPAQRERLTEINTTLASLHTQFAQNVLADESGWYMRLVTAEDLAGLPQWLVAATGSAAAEAGLEADAKIVTLSRSLVVPFLTHSHREDLRQRAWQAWMNRGLNGGATDNRELIGSILQLRQELATIHSYPTFSHYQLADTMAQEPAAVDRLLDAVWVPARAAALAEYEELTALARRASGVGTEVNGWDWRYYSEQVRREKFDLDEEQLAPYLSLDNMLGAAFDCASRLFGVTFHERRDVELYHPDVRTFEVHDVNGELFGVFLSDNFARPTKTSGAWMSQYRHRAEHLTGFERFPVVANHNNFAKAADGKPTMLSIDDALTLFHEFGHGLHGLLSQSPFYRTSGVNVLIDFVELPSQLFEHWLREPEVLRRHALHIETGQPMPDHLIEKLTRAAHFNQGFDTVEYLASAMLDQRLHRAAADGPVDLIQFEREQLAEIGMPSAIPMRHRLPHFSHLFASTGYASAYYVYLWAQVLDADAFDAFVEAGDLFDPTVSASLLQHVYSPGDTVEPGAAYRAFRGRDAGIEPLLRGRGFVQ